MENKVNGKEKIKSFLKRCDAALEDGRKQRVKEYLDGKFESNDEVIVDLLSSLEENVLSGLDVYDYFDYCIDNANNDVMLLGYLISIDTNKLMVNLIEDNIAKELLMVTFESVFKSDEDGAITFLYRNSYYGINGVEITKISNTEFVSGKYTLITGPNINVNKLPTYFTSEAAIKLFDKYINSGHFKSIIDLDSIAVIDILPGKDIMLVGYVYKENVLYCYRIYENGIEPIKTFDAEDCYYDPHDHLLYVVQDGVKQYVYRDEEAPTALVLRDIENNLIIQL